jgi:hypothetical protein
MARTGRPKLTTEKKVTQTFSALRSEVEELMSYYPRKTISILIQDFIYEQLVLQRRLKEENK